MNSYRVVFQLARPGIEFHETVVRNARNIAAELEDVMIRLVVHGEGIDFVTGHTKEIAAVHDALESGVDVIACQNTLRRKNIPDDAVILGVRLVPAGLAELVRLQHDGWAYIHP